MDTDYTWRYCTVCSQTPLHRLSKGSVWETMALTTEQCLVLSVQGVYLKLKVILVPVVSGWAGSSLAAQTE